MASISNFFFLSLAECFFKLFVPFRNHRSVWLPRKCRKIKIETENFRNFNILAPGNENLHSSEPNNSIVFVNWIFLDFLCNQTESLLLFW